MSDVRAMIEPPFSLSPKCTANSHGRVVFESDAPDTPLGMPDAMTTLVALSFFLLLRQEEGVQVKDKSLKRASECLG